MVDEPVCLCGEHVESELISESNALLRQSHHQPPVPLTMALQHQQGLPQNNLQIDGVVKISLFVIGEPRTKKEIFSCCKFAILSFILLYLHNFYSENLETIHSIILGKLSIP